MTVTHRDLVMRAEKWLERQGCSVILRDPFWTYTMSGEKPDTIGWRCSSTVSILIECKVSREDFLADKRKPFRQDPCKGMGDWRFYLCPPEVINVEDLPGGWGLLWAMPKTIKAVTSVPRQSEWKEMRPFSPCKRSETLMLASAVRRLALRGHLPEIYEDLSVSMEKKRA